MACPCRFSFNIYYTCQMDSEYIDEMFVPANPGYALDVEYKKKITERINKQFAKHQGNQKLLDSSRLPSETIGNTSRKNQHSSLVNVDEDSLSSLSSLPKNTKKYVKNQETNISLPQSNSLSRLKEVSETVINKDIRNVNKNIKTESSSQILCSSPDILPETYTSNINSPIQEPSSEMNIRSTCRNSNLKTSKQKNKNSFKIPHTNSPHSSSSISQQNEKKSQSPEVIIRKRSKKFHNHVNNKNCLDSYEQVVPGEFNINNPKRKIKTNTRRKQNMTVIESDACSFAGGSSTYSYADSAGLQSGKKSQRSTAVGKQQAFRNSTGTNSFSKSDQEICSKIDINNAEENSNLQTLKKKSNNFRTDKTNSPSTSSSNNVDDDVNQNTNMTQFSVVTVGNEHFEHVDYTKDNKGFSNMNPELDIDGAQALSEVIVRNRKRKLNVYKRRNNNSSLRSFNNNVIICQTDNKSLKQKSRNQRSVTNRTFEFRVENCTSPIELSVVGNVEDAPVVKEGTIDNNFNWITFCGEVKTLCSTSTSLIDEKDGPKLDSDSSDESAILQTPLQNASVIPVIIGYNSKSVCNDDERISDSASVDHIDIMHDNSELTCNEVDQNLGSTFTELSFSEKTSEKINDQTFGSFELIDIDSCRTLLTLNPNSRVYFHGLSSFQLLSGEVEVLGYNLEPFKTIDVYSPRGSSFLYVETTINDEPVKAINKANLANQNIPDHVLRKLDQLLPGSAAIMCKKLELTKISFLEKYIPQQIFPKLEESPIDCSFLRTIINRNVLKINPYWNTVAQEVNEGCRLLICGGKSVGKSFLSRYLINKIIQKHKKILFIDLDPGQSEFTIPGCVSATIIDEPVFGPNYTHLREPYKCIFLPDVNISYCFMKYIQVIKDLMLSIEEVKCLPTIVNFMGYTRGVGFKILAAVVAIVKPSDILEIKSTRKARNYLEDLHHSTIITAAEKLAPEITSIPFFTYKCVSSMSDDVQGWHLEPRQIREMSVLCYFGDILANCDCSLTHRNVPIYEFNLSKIKLIYEDKIVEPAVVNANLVALCTTLKTNTYSCHGWGIVRGINLDLNVCYVITPMSLEKLRTVECFILGAIRLPPSIYMAKHCTGLIPYVATNIEEHGSIPKRTHLPRRNFYN